MHASKTSDRDHPAVAGDPLVFSLPTDSFTCEDCGRTVVPTNDHLPDLRLDHRCDSRGEADRG